MAKSLVHVKYQFLEATGVTEDALLGLDDLPSLAGKTLSNGAVIELALFRQKNGLRWKVLGRWLADLLDITDDLHLPSEQNLRNVILKLINKRDGLSKNRRRNESALIEFLNERFEMPTSHLTDHPPQETVVDNAACAPTEAHSDTEESELQNVKDKLTLQTRVAQNLSKKLKRRDERVQKEKSNALQFKHQLEKAESKLSRAQEAKMKYRAQAKYQSKMRQHVEEEIVHLADEVEVKGVENAKILDDIAVQVLELEERVKYLQRENEALQAEINDIKEMKLPTKVGRKYTENVRQCCMELLSHNVSLKNVAAVIDSVLRNMVGLKAEDLPHYTTINRMLIEMKAVAQQLADLLTSEENLTLHSDGTTKFGQHYQSFQLSATSSTYSLGLSEILSGSAENTLESLKLILGDIDATLGKSVGNSILAGIKNTMSDRHVVQKSFNGLLEDYRSEVLPEVVKGWSDLQVEQRERLSLLNNFFCGLHLLVGMAETAAASIGEWENIHFEELAIGAAALPSHWKKNESGTVRLIRTACKAFQRYGSGQAGVYLQFSTFLISKGVNHNPLITFRGNRFNVLFHNAGALYYIAPFALEFLEVWGAANQLLRAVIADLKVPQFIAGCRALGLISKCVTGPLWRLLESPNVSILDMSNWYQHMVEKFEIWSDDASQVLSGDVILFPEVPIKKDSIWECLTKSSDNDALCQEILQVIFTSLTVLCRRLLVDHLEGDLAQPTAELKAEANSVPKTNVISERDFALLDRLLRQKPNSHTVALEGLILFSNNKTAKWLSSKTDEERKKIIAIAIAKGPEIRRQYRERRTIMLQKRAEILRKKQAEVEKRKQQELLEKEQLTQLILQYGLWQTPAEVEEKVLQMKTKKGRIQALRCQLDFRRKVLLQSYRDKTVFQLSHKGKVFTPEEMARNLCLLLSSQPSSQQEITPHHREKHSGIASELLIGKTIKHLWKVDDSEVWFTGKVLSRVPGTEDWFNIIYDGEDQVVSLNITEDISKGDLMIL